MNNAKFKFFKNKHNVAKKSKKDKLCLKKKKLLYCSPFVWKKIFLFKTSYVFKLTEKLIYTRSSVVPVSFNKLNVSIYTGRKWKEKIINKWMVGFKFGEFTWNRKLALYKAKQLKKKKK